MGGATGEGWGYNVPLTFAAYTPHRGYNEIHIRLLHLEILLLVQVTTTMTLKISHTDFKTC